MPDILNFRKPTRPSVLPTHLLSGANTTFALCISPFLMLPKPKVAFFLCTLLLCSICVVGSFGFFPSLFERDSTVYVYKLNEDEKIILYKVSREQSA